jgi:hypothetical protein
VRAATAESDAESRRGLSLFTTAAADAAESVADVLSTATRRQCSAHSHSGPLTSLRVHTGSHEIDCVCWRPTGDLMENIYSFFLGGE